MSDWRAKAKRTKARQVRAGQMLVALERELTAWAPGSDVTMQVLMVSGGGQTTEVGAWGDDDGDAYKRALTALAADPGVEKAVAAFGDDALRFTESFMEQTLRRPHRSPNEAATARLMHATALLYADPICRMVLAGDVVRTREQIENVRPEAMAMPPSPERNRRILECDGRLAILPQPDDPTVVRRKPTAVAKHRLTNRPVSDDDYSHYLAARESLRLLAREIFGEAGDHVADVFIRAVTDVRFSRDDRRTPRR
jgi:hypothetical protein